MHAAVAEAADGFDLRALPRLYDLLGPQNFYQNVSAHLNRIHLWIGEIALSAIGCQQGH